MSSLRKVLKGKIPDNLLGLVKRGFDSVGSIAIIEIPEELEKFEKVIANALIDNIKNIHTVLKKVGIRYGRYRRQKLKWLAGKRTKVTEHKESGCRIRLDVEKCYFSPRLSHERLRIAGLIKQGECVLVAFSGVAPYPLVFAKNSPSKFVVGVELNPVAHRFAEENVRINKLQGKVKVIEGDVAKVVPNLGRFDRVVMAMPKGGERFLEFCVPAVKKGGVLHFYDFGRFDEFEMIAEKVRQACLKVGRDCRILRKVKAGEHAPRVYRVCVDAEVI
ncbi:class I SAM-dependent methyltransferase family protein [Candidatus Woesearchaeota archaeon]|nr:MAG: class I SAM-dependent methyltransferase family protein [Candidatus Woesearchaeota archaeon]